MTRFLLAALATSAVLACGSPEAALQPSNAKAGAGPTVTATDPPYGTRGATSLTVAIAGSGFDQGSRASWERNGAADPKITVRSTQFVTSNQVIATIDIAADASLSFYDVAVTTAGGRKGIGTERFEVTQAIAIAGTESAFGVNGAGEATGRIGPPGSFFWSPTTGLEPLGSPGRTYGISEDGLTVAGFTGVCCYGAFVHERVAGSWQLTVLAKEAAADFASARAVGSDPVTGAAVVVGGLEGYPANGNNLNRKPRLWIKGLGGWTRVALPAPAGTADSPLFGVNGAGVGVGVVIDRAAVWEPNGTGGWTQTLIGLSGSQASGVNSAGTIVVGFASDRNTKAAQYWQRSGSTWVAAGLAGGCSEAKGVDDLGRILLNDCPNGNRRTPAIISPPYAAADVRLLGGLGTASGSSTIANGISANGAWVAGEASLKGSTVGVRWTGQ